MFDIGDRVILLDVPDVPEKLRNTEAVVMAIDMKAKENILTSINITVADILGTRLEGLSEQSMKLKQ